MAVVASPYERFMVGPKEPVYACGFVKGRPNVPALQIRAPRARTSDSFQAGTDGLALEAMHQNESYRVIAPATVDSQRNASALVPLSPELTQKLSAAPIVAIVATRKFGDKFRELAETKIDKKKLMDTKSRCRELTGAG